MQSECQGGALVDTIESSIESLSSDSQLSEYETRLRRMAKRASIDEIRVEIAMGVISEKRERLAEPTRRPHVPDGLDAEGPVISFARSGLCVPWSNRYASLLELAEACDVPVRWPCRSGVCHHCESRVLEGQFSYKPDPIESPPDGRILLCCFRPAGPMVVDL